MEQVYTEQHNGYTIKVFYDQDAQSPQDWGNDDIVGWLRHFTVENKKLSREQFGYILGRKLKDQDMMNEYADYKISALEVIRDYHVFGVDAYVHSGVALHLHGEGYRDRWDTIDYVGAVLVAKKEEKACGKAYRIAQGIIETWNDYLSGNVYGFIVEDNKGENIASCWGFYGDYRTSGALTEARTEADYNYAARLQKHFAKKRAEITHNVPLERRVAFSF